MLTVGRDHRPAAAFRLQLFTAPGTRPVAVVIQRHGEGASMFNAAERYAEAVWQRHCPDEDAPPVWIQRFIFPWRDHDPFRIVTYPVRTARPGNPARQRADAGKRTLSSAATTKPDTGTLSVARPCPRPRPWPSVESRRSTAPLPPPGRRPLYVRGHRDTAPYSATR
jgi:hypothetical protein